MNQRALDYRILWTWDSWVCDPFSAESYVSEYCSLIDWMSESGYNGLIIWGFIDGRHGGIASAKRVASHGKARGVRIMTGVGAGGYHGFSISPGLPYNLDDLLQAKPYLKGAPRDGEGQLSDWCARTHHPEFLQWLEDGAKWLAETFDLGGVNIETNEMQFIDISEGTSEITAREPNRLKYAASFSDLAAAVPVIHRQLAAVNHDCWTTYAVYEPAWWHRQEDAWLLKDIPDETIAQWNMEFDHTPTAPPPARRNISLVHSGGWCYPYRAFPKTWAFTQYRCFLPLIEQMRQFGFNQSTLGVDGFVLGNAGSHNAPDNEINYLAALDFASDPELTIEHFAQRRIASLYGSDAADSVLKMFLRQPAIHHSLLESWRWFAKLLCEGHVEGALTVSTPEAIEAAQNQIKLISECISKTMPEGQRRLQLAAQIMGEYLAFAEMSTLAIFQQTDDQSMLVEAAILEAASRGIDLKYYLTDI